MTTTSLKRLPKTSKASNFIAAYADWIRGVDKNSTAWEERLSEPDFFAKSVLEWPEDVSCGAAYNGCDGRPLCDDISERIENRTRARQICYVFDSFHHVSLISAQVHEQSKAAQAAGDAKCREFASTFFWQLDPSVQKKCELFTNLVKAGITAVMFGAFASAPLAALAVFGAFAAAEAEVAVALEAGIGEAASIVESEAGKVGVEVGEEVGEAASLTGTEAGEGGSVPRTDNTEAGEGGNVPGTVVIGQGV